MGLVLLGSDFGAGSKAGGVGPVFRGRNVSLQCIWIKNARRRHGFHSPFGGQHLEVLL